MNFVVCYEMNLIWTKARDNEKKLMQKVLSSFDSKWRINLNFIIKQKTLMWNKGKLIFWISFPHEYHKKIIHEISIKRGMLRYFQLKILFCYKKNLKFVWLELVLFNYNVQNYTSAKMPHILVTWRKNYVSFHVPMPYFRQYWTLLLLNNCRNIV